MANHHRTVSPSNSPTKASHTTRGRRSLKVAAVAAATGAILTGSAQIGVTTAAAAPLQLPILGNVEIELPAGLLLPRVPAPAAPATPTPPAAPAPQQWTPSDQQWTPAPKKLAPAPAPTPAPAPAPDATPAPAPAPANRVFPQRARAIQPVSGVLTSGYGPRWGTHHNGIDIGANLGTPIYSAADGVIINAGPASGFGQWVRVQHDDGTITVYGHVDTFTVGVGERVVAGQQIATVGNRGQSTGPHLHFEVWDPAGNQVDPQIWLRDNDVAVTWGG
ncbi:M23 family metallopeptidase [Rhodococcus sp. ABRD24]|uniref:M23 family metallopeptidase n=1 Tax=Rhodococcus sp. ABRD24 TaxID=2507582 RepID=UPI00103A1F0D|nr:M23 family metallopeptidase [Rhodococcus sp. ABRD24]QBJ96302.1 M23 family metallopeptidase [Rhodococcus sp. ABRD24]